jgi:solute carrier family 25 iron transporter 28/37
MHYAAYEFFKERFGGNLPGYHPIATASAGALATMAHDAIVTPLDVVKQRLQLSNSPYKSVTHCIQTTFREEGARAFYASYPTTVFMNVPFMAVHFASYESFKLLFTHLQGKHQSEHGPVEEMVAGGVSGAAAGLLSNPFDVIKTRIQTQNVNAAAPVFAHAGAHLNQLHREATADLAQHAGCSSCAVRIPHTRHSGEHIAGAREIARSIYQHEGWRGFMRGASARVIYFMPSAAICWTTYETFKRILRDAW